MGQQIIAQKELDVRFKQIRIKHIITSKGLIIGSCQPNHIYLGADMAFKAFFCFCFGSCSILAPLPSSFTVNPPGNKGPPSLFVPCLNRSPPPDPDKNGPNKTPPFLQGKLRGKWGKGVDDCLNRSPPPRAKKVCHLWSRVDFY